MNEKAANSRLTTAVIIIHICAFWINATSNLHIREETLWSGPKSTSNRPYSNTNTHYHTHISPPNTGHHSNLFLFLPFCLCIPTVDLNEDHVPFHLTLSALTYLRHAPLQSLYTGVPTELCPGTWAKTTEHQGGDWKNTTAYLLRDWAYCFVFIFHIYLRTCAIASAPPAFHRCSWLKSQSFWIFCDFCTISKSALLVHKALSVCEMF